MFVKWTIWHHRGLVWEYWQPGSVKHAAWNSGSVQCAVQRSRNGNSAVWFLAIFYLYTNNNTLLLHIKAENQKLQTILDQRTKRILIMPKETILDQSKEQSEF